MLEIERFWAKVQQTDDCWLWTGARSDRGYGNFRAYGRQVLVHRFAYELLVGPIPSGMYLDHRVTCPKHCVNPAHLRPVTCKQNQENRLGARRDSASGVRGVTFVGNKWRATVVHHQKRYSTWYATMEEAAEAVRLKRIELFTHNDEDRTC